jgi:FkbM family methyltransferase
MAMINKYISPPHNQIPGWREKVFDVFGYRKDGFFVEVGAWDGIQWSPARMLAVAGWAGIFFEPQTKMFSILNHNYADRPDITCVKKAISNFAGITTLFYGGSVSTIREDVKQLYLEIPELGQTGLAHNKSETVEVAKLDQELTRLGAPVGFDILVIDVEGAEMDVLDCFDIGAWQPRMVVIEAHEQHKDERMSRKSIPINDYMTHAGYLKTFSDEVNNVYVSN